MIEVGQHAEDLLEHRERGALRRPRGQRRRGGPDGRPADPRAPAQDGRRALAEGIHFVVIWHASGPGTAVPAACPPGHGQPSTDVGRSARRRRRRRRRLQRLRAPRRARRCVRHGRGEAAHPADYYFGCEGPTDPRRRTRSTATGRARTDGRLATPRTHRAPRPPGLRRRLHPGRPPAAHQRLGSTRSTISETAINLIEPEGYTTVRTRTRTPSASGSWRGHGRAGDRPAVPVPARVRHHRAGPRLGRRQRGRGGRRPGGPARGDERQPAQTDRDILLALQASLPAEAARPARPGRGVQGHRPVGRGAGRLHQGGRRIRPR